MIIPHDHNYLKISTNAELEEWKKIYGLLWGKGY